MRPALLLALAALACSCATIELTPQVLAEIEPPYWIPERYQRIAAAEAAAHGVPLWLLGRLIEAESGWDPYAVGVNADGSRDEGLAQLNSRYSDGFDCFNAGLPVDPFDPGHALRIACGILVSHREATGSWRGAVEAYNCGLGRWRRGDLPAVTIRHVSLIFND